MKTKMVKKTNNRQPRIVYTTGYTGVKSDIVFSDNLFVGSEVVYDNPNPFNGFNLRYTTPLISNNATLQTRRFFYILWYLRERGIRYQYYTGRDRTWQEVIKDKVGNCCDLVALIDVLASQAGMSSDCGTPITNRQFIKDLIWQDGTSYYHVYNRLEVDGNWLLLDPTNYVATGNILPLGRWVGTLQNPINLHFYDDVILGDEANPIQIYDSTEEPCP